ncbi:MAG TPA: regulatory protein RecX [Candidatus Limnocylindrales bacterium]|jgi:SOS response regulatory protein OraA/RecX|nr:regulatory protein RecX [Candidatus Limnocylindrales bacterium]
MPFRRAERAADRRARRSEVDDPAVVAEAAAAFLAVRSRSVGETRRRLRHLGYPAGIVEQVLARLMELGILDDAAFARAWVESRDRARPRGESALRHELALKGVDRAIVDELLAERAAASRSGEGPRAVNRGTDADAGDRRAVHRGMDAGHDDEELGVDELAARRLLERRLPSLLREPDARRRRQKAYALLARNGFDPEVCRTVSASVPDANGEN